MWRPGSSDAVCPFPPQACQVGLNFASEEETKRFRGHLSELLDRRQRKSGTCCRPAELNDTLPVNLVLKNQPPLVPDLTSGLGSVRPGVTRRTDSPGTCHFSESDQTEPVKEKLE